MVFLVYHEGHHGSKSFPQQTSKEKSPKYFQLIRLIKTVFLELQPNSDCRVWKYRTVYLLIYWTQTKRWYFEQPYVYSRVHCVHVLTVHSVTDEHWMSHFRMKVMNYMKHKKLKAETERETMRRRRASWDRWVWRRERREEKEGWINKRCEGKKKPEWMLKATLLSANQSIPPPLLLVSRLCDWPVGAELQRRRERE